MPRMWQYRPYLKLDLSVKSPPNAQNCFGGLTDMRLIYRKSELSNLLTSTIFGINSDPLSFENSNNN